MHNSHNLRTFLLFLATGVTWGSSFFFIKIALTGVSFGQIAWVRILLGAITLGIIVIIGRHPLPRQPRIWLHFFVIGATFCAIPFLLFAWAEQYVPSGLASIYNAATALSTAIFAALIFRVEQLNRAQVTGIFVGLLGVVIIIGPWGINVFSGDLLGQLACLAAAICYGFALGYTRRFLSPRAIPGVPFAFMQVAAAAIIMLLLTPFIAQEAYELSPLVLVSLLFLGVLGTGFVYIWNINTLRSWGPTAASTVSYIVPVIGILLGVLILGETLSWNEPAGAILVFAGILLAQKRFKGLKFWIWKRRAKK